MHVYYNPVYAGANIDEHNCHEVTGFDIDTMLSFTGVHGYSADYDFTISGKYPIVRINIAHAEYELQRTIYFDESRVKNDYFDVKNTHRGIGKSVFAAQVESLSANGFDHIRVHALGGEGCEEWNGHITWAKFGFTMDNGSDILKFRALIKKHNRKEDTLNELLQSKEGMAIWELEGFSWNGIFYLNNDSKNKEILRNYLARYN